MGADTGISWADDTFNPWWGCTRVSPGCEKCYAEQLATVRRKLPIWGVDAERKAMSDQHWKLPAKWNREAEHMGIRRRVFCASMADVFETPPERNTQAWGVMNDARNRLWAAIYATPMLDWLLLTKRPENVATIAPFGTRWPPNVWLGTTVEDRPRLSRIEHLRAIPAQRRFVSYEPALEGVDYRGHLEGVDWLIIGGESGSNARPFDVAWARDAIAAAREAKVAPFMKQLGTAPRFATNDRMFWDKGSHAKKWDVLAEWPADIRVQEWPRSPAADASSWAGFGAA